MQRVTHRNTKYQVRSIVFWFWENGELVADQSPEQLGSKKGLKAVCQTLSLKN